MITLCTTDKANKNNAYELIKQLKHGETLTPYLIDTLLNYFAPPAPKKIKENWQWVAQAVAKKDVRVYLYYLRAQDGILYGTDGHRLHYIKTDLVNGYYCPKTLSLVEDGSIGNYPDCTRITGFKFKSEAHSITDFTLHIRDERNAPRIYKHESMEFGIDTQYVEQGISNLETEIFIGEDGDKVKGSNQFGEFIIMGMRI